jgi:TonB family protein
MSTLSKETTDALSISSVESAAPGTGTQPPSASAQLHSDAVSLEVPLKVHGSKVPARGAAPHPEPFEEETSSMIVFPHGGVLRMATSVNAGQMLVLTNLKSRQDAICRVIKVRSYSKSSSYVEVEFTHRQPGFWGVYFESDSAAPAVKPTDPAEPAAKSPRQAATGTSLSKSSPQDRKESSFIGIGSQEDVQPAASSTSSLKSKTPAQDSKSGQKSGAAGQHPAGKIGSLPSQLAKNQQQEEDASIASEAPEIHELDEPFDAAGSLRASAKKRAVSGEAFGSHRGLTSRDAEGSEDKKNWLLIAACVAALLLAVGGAVLLSHRKSPDDAAAQALLRQAQAAQAQAAQSQFAQNQSSSGLIQSSAPPQSRAQATSSVSPNVPPPISSRSTIIARSPKDNVVITEAPVAVETSGQAAAPKRSVPNVYGALNSRPVAPRQRAEGIAAPRMDAIALGADPLAGIASSSGPTAPPSVSLRVTAPVQTLTGPKEPTLLVRVIPQYPPMARQTHTEGDVILNIAIDTAGNVTEAKVVSGPTVLHMAAVGAVKRWKYRPVDGQAGPVKLAVTIQFRL